MKVTRLIREYVNREICSAYAEKVNPYTELVEKDKEAYKKFEDKMNAKIEKEAEKFFAEHKAIHYSYNKVDTTPYDGKSYYLSNNHSPYSPYYYMEKNWNKERNKKCQEKIDEVLLNLELGANREELNKMMTEIIKQIKEEK